MFIFKSIILVNNIRKKIMMELQPVCNLPKAISNAEALVSVQYPRQVTDTKRASLHQRPHSLLTALLSLPPTRAHMPRRGVGEGRRGSTGGKRAARGHSRGCRAQLCWSFSGGRRALGFLAEQCRGRVIAVPERF